LLAGIDAVFVLFVASNTHLRTLLTVALVVVVLGAGTVLGQRLAVGRVGRIASCAVAIVALWLLDQRDDVASAVVLASLFGVGAGIAVGSAKQARATSRPGARASVATLVVFTCFVTMYVGAETPAASWFGGGITHGPTNGNDVALTFDDGPDITSTLRVMAILDRYGVKATFFEVGKAVDANPNITRSLYSDGQLIGNHSYHHDQWRWLDPRYPELQRDQKAIDRAIGVCPGLYRPPHGERTPFLARVVRDHHMHMVLWNVSAGDWATDNAQLVAQRIVGGAKPGAILLLHDGLDGNPTANRQVVVDALPLILDGLRAKGLTPVRLDDLLHVRPYVKC
jgi:peptidoglycan/xylan/chitin deacetylase (PgdA/CDA1 family)